MIYGYTRVSSKDQCLDRQLDAIKKYRQVDQIFADKQSGKNFDRAGYQEMKDMVQAGDEVIVKELDRLGRNKDELKKELEWFKAHGVIVRILDIPTTLIDFQGQAWVGDMLNNILIEVIGAIAEQEREKIRTRQKEGFDAMKARGEWDKMGRPKVNIDNTLFENLRKKQKNGSITVTECCRQLGISRRTWYNLV